MGDLCLVPYPLLWAALATSYGTSQIQRYMVGRWLPVVVCRRYANFSLFNHGFLEPPQPRWRLSVPRRSILNVSAKTKKAINDSSKFYAIHPLHRENRWNLRPQLKRFLQIGTVLEQNWMSSSSYTSNLTWMYWSFQKRKKAIFYFFRVQTQGVLNVFILCGRFLFLEHNIQTLNFGAGYILIFSG